MARTLQGKDVAIGQFRLGPATFPSHGGEALEHIHRSNSSCDVAKGLSMPRAVGAKFQEFSVFQLLQFGIGSQQFIVSLDQFLGGVS